MAKEKKETKAKAEKPKKEATIQSVVAAEYAKNPDKKGAEIAEKYGFKVESVNWYLTKLRHPTKKKEK